MAEHVGASGVALESARAVLAARDRELAAADAELAEVLTGAYAAAMEAIRKLDTLSAEIEAMVAHHAAIDPHEGRELARFLLQKQREAIDILTAARADAEAKAVVLRELMTSYQHPSLSV